MRTLALAYMELDENANVIVDGKLSTFNLKFVGVYALQDDIREGVKASMEECMKAGIAVKVVTGDNPGTAKEIAKKIGLWTKDDSDKNIITGTELAKLSDKQLEERVMDIKIIARARPMDKKRLVDALRRLDQVVAVTGDGTNDAPALNAADVGLAMGNGTQVAKDASDMIIQDNSFSTIANAVMWGRSLYKNIQRFLVFQLTVNVAACLIVTICSYFSEQSPLTVTQMLWVNLIMDTLAALSLASLPPQESVMSDKPRRPGKAIITREMKNFILWMSVPIALAMSALFYVFWRSGNINTHEMSVFFSVFVFIQVWNLLNARRFDGGAGLLKDWRESKVFLGVLALITVFQVLIVQTGGAVFSVEPLSLKEWLLIIGGTSLVLLAGYPLTRKRRA